MSVHLRVCQPVDKLYPWKQVRTPSYLALLCSFLLLRSVRTHPCVLVGPPCLLDLGILLLPEPSCALSQNSELWTGGILCAQSGESQRLLLDIRGPFLLGCLRGNVLKHLVGVSKPAAK